MLDTSDTKKQPLRKTTLRIPYCTQIGFTRFTFLSVFISIIIGLGVTHLLEGLAQLMQANPPVSLYWVHLFWVFIVLILLVQFWWALWDFVDVKWTFLSYILYLCSPIVLFILSDLSFPESYKDFHNSLFEYFDNIRKPFFTFFSFYVALTIANAFYIRGRRHYEHDNKIRYIGFLITLAPIFFGNRIFHSYFTLIALAGLISFLYIRAKN